MAGRPKLYDWFLTVGFTDQQSAYIEFEAAEMGVAFGEVVRDAVQSVMDNRDVASRQGNPAIKAVL